MSKKAYFAPHVGAIVILPTEGIMQTASSNHGNDNDPYSNRVEGNENGGIAIPRPIDDDDDINNYNFQF